MIRACVLVSRLLRRYSDVHELLYSPSLPLSQAVTHCVDGSVVGLLSSETCFMALLEPGLPAGVAHKTAEAAHAIVRKTRDRFIIHTVPNW